jgi:hypothetical protein
VYTTIVSEVEIFPDGSWQFYDGVGGAGHGHGHNVGDNGSSALDVCTPTGDAKATQALASSAGGTDTNTSPGWMNVKLEPDSSSVVSASSIHGAGTGAPSVPFEIDLTDD